MNVATVDEIPSITYSKCSNPVFCCFFNNYLVDQHYHIQWPIFGSVDADVMHCETPEPDPDQAHDDLDAGQDDDGQEVQPEQLQGPFGDDKAVYVIFYHVYHFLQNMYWILNWFDKEILRQ